MVGLSAIALAGLIARCAPEVGPVTMAAVVRYESGGRPFAIGDNTTRHAYIFDAASTAEQTARVLMARGDNLDLGLAQVNQAHIGEPGVTLETLFDPCTNLAAGARILVADYRRAVRVYGPGQRALAHALSAYNSGSLDAGAKYANAVFASARTLPAAFARRPSAQVVAVRHDTPDAALANAPIVVHFDNAKRALHDLALAPIVVAAGAPTESVP